MLDSTFVKIISWYDNEVGYSNKLLELAKLVASKLWWFLFVVFSL